MLVRIVIVLNMIALFDNTFRAHLLVPQMLSMDIDQRLQVYAVIFIYLRELFVVIMAHKYTAGSNTGSSALIQPWSSAGLSQDKG